nr:25s rrna (cytosine-c(5))-methyltransferase rcm1 [Quercus suber]
MSLYHEAAHIIDTSRQHGGSLKSLVFGKKTWKSDGKTLFALTTEAAKWSAVLAEVVEKSGVLRLERQLSPTLVLVLTHDLLLARKGVALPAKHGLHAAIAKHKARLSAELTKARLRRGFATLEDLRASVNSGSTAGVGDGEVPDSSGGGGRKAASPHPRWIRINTIRTTLAEQLDTTFADYMRVDSVAAVTQRSSATPSLHIDRHIPNLIAISPHVPISSSKAYKEGKLILQDKASCFPAYLLDPCHDDGDVIDACAAPGNKTTHLAALIHEGSRSARPRHVFACEKDAVRSRTLEKMTTIAGAGEIITIRATQDSMKLDPRATKFRAVTALLLDPSCSGSGIVGRDEGAVVVHLPSLTNVTSTPSTKSKKRKRGAAETRNLAPPVELESEAQVQEEETALPADADGAKLAARLTALAEFQLRLVRHAMAFPAARRIAYSTCSVHAEENEHVVVKALQSEIAVSGGWRILEREEQVEGMRAWQKRGWEEKCRELGGMEVEAARKVARGCIRCEKGSEEGTMGFFVAAFVRDAQDGTLVDGGGEGGEWKEEGEDDGTEDEEEWNGFG